MLKKNNNPTNVTYKKITEWLNIYHSSNDALEKEKVKTLIVTNMYPVIRNIAKTIARRDYDPIEDLTQAGFIGLLKAIEKYNPNVNDNFRVYAGFLIIGEIKHYIRDQLNSIKIPRYIQELSIRINSFIETLTPEEVKNITSNKIAKALSVKENIVDLTIESERRRETISLEEAFKTTSNNMTYEEMIVDEKTKNKLVYEDARIIFEDIINKLPEEHRVIVEMYYTQDYTQKEIADALVVSEMSVNRKLKQAFELIAELVAEKSVNKKDHLLLD